MILINYSEKNENLLKKKQVPPSFKHAFKNLQKADIQKVYLEQLLENSGEAIVIMDPNEYILYINKEFTRLFGYSKEEAFGRFINDLLVPKDRYHEGIVTRERVAKREEMKIETVRRRKDGSRVHVSIAGMPIEFNKKVIGVYGIYRDLTEQKKAQAALQKNEERYRSIVEHMQDCFYRIDASGTLVMASPSTVKFLGSTAEELIGKPMTDFYQNKEDRKVFLNLLKKTGRIENYPLHLKKTDGTKVTVSDCSHFYHDETGQIAGVEGVFRDITKLNQVQEELATSQRLFDDILQDSPLATYVINMDHKIIYWNKEMERISGRKTSEMIGTDSHWEVFYPKKRPMIVDYFVNGNSIPQILEHYKNMDVERSRIKNSVVGSVFFADFYGGGKWLRFIIKPLYDHRNKMIGAIETVEDIHWRKEAEIELRKRLKELECLYKVVDATRMTTPIAQVLIDITRFIVSAWKNPKETRARITLDDQQYTWQSFKETPHKQEVPLIINGIKRGKISVYIVNKPAHPADIFSPEEETLLKNIARLINKHLERRQSMEQYQKLVQKSIAGIYILKKNKFAFANPEFCKIFKCPQKKVIDATLEQFLPGCARYHRNYKKNHSIRSFIARGKRHDGKKVFLEIVTQVIDHQGEPAVMGTMHDITKLKEAEKRVQNFNQELKNKIIEKTAHLEEANEQLASLNILKDEFISIASHELRSPITSVKGFLSLAKEDPDFGKVPYFISQYFNRAYENADILNRLIHNILDVSLLGRGQLSVHKKRTDVVNLIGSIIMSAIPQASEKGVPLKLINRIKSKEYTFLEVDEVRVRQTIRNLIDNAIKFSPSGHPIRIHLEKADRKKRKWLKVSVEDRGMGIKKSELHYIFDKFRSGKDNYKKGKWGAGLGLYIVKKVVELHNGFVEVTSAPRRGSVFSIFLPYRGDKK